MPWPIPPMPWPALRPPLLKLLMEPAWPLPTVVALLPWTLLLPWVVLTCAFVPCDVAWLDRRALLTTLPSLSPLSCAILPQPSPPLCSATMSSKLLPDALASKWAFSNPPQPSPVDVLSACNVATGTPVSLEILVKSAPRERAAPNRRKEIAIIKLNVFTVKKVRFRAR